MIPRLSLLQTLEHHTKSVRAAHGGQLVPDSSGESHEKLQSWG